MDNKKSIRRKLRLRSLAREVFGRLPKSVRHKMLRKMVRFPTKENSELVFKVAETKEEYKAALRIVHEEYLRCGITNSNEHGLRVTKYHTLPTTAVLICKKGDEVIATVTVIRDGILGVPMASIFDIDHLRSKGRCGEVSCLAVAQKYRQNSGEVLFPMIAYMRQFAEQNFGVEQLVIAVNPTHIDFYESILGFERVSNETVAGYEYVAGADAIGAYLDMRTAPEKWIEMYGDAPPDRCAYHFFYIMQPSNYQYPASRFNKITHDNMDADTFNSLFIETKTINEIDPHNVRRIANQIVAEDVRSQLTDRIFGHPDRIDARVEVNCETSLLNASASVNARLVNISTNGACLEVSEKIEGVIAMNVKLNRDESANVLARIRWCDGKNAGLEIVKAEPIWQEFINEIVGRSVRVSAAVAA